MEEYYNIIQKIIIIMITNDLTIGRCDDDLPPLPINEIEDFIKNNNSTIQKVIKIIIEDYEKDNDLELLKNPEFDRIGEYLYEYIDTRVKFL